jgi:hypothetical protein
MPKVEDAKVRLAKPVAPSPVVPLKVQPFLGGVTFEGLQSRVELRRGDDDLHGAASA